VNGDVPGRPGKRQGAGLRPAGDRRPAACCWSFAADGRRSCAVSRPPRLWP